MDSKPDLKSASIKDIKIVASPIGVTPEKMKSQKRTVEAASPKSRNTG